MGDSLTVERAALTRLVLVRIQVPQPARVIPCGLRLVWFYDGKKVKNMSEHLWNVYLSGEIHTAWRDDIRSGVDASALPVNFLEPVTVHEDSDDCGVVILGEEEDNFWHDRKGAAMNSIRTRALIGEADIVVVRFGDKFRQWNAAYDAGVAVALGKSLITLHEKSLDHALKEVDAAASAVCRKTEQVVATLRYVALGQLDKKVNDIAAE